MATLLKGRMPGMIGKVGTTISSHSDKIAAIDHLVMTWEQ
jgi:hypothetical protein